MPAGHGVDVSGLVRRAVRSPGLSLLTIATLGLTLAAVIVGLSLVRSTLVSPLAVPDPGRLVVVSVNDGKSGQPIAFVSESFDALRAQQTSLRSLSTYHVSLWRLEGRGATMDVLAEHVMPAYFDAVGFQLAAGRQLTDEDVVATSTGSNVAIISDRLWQRLFDRDPAAIGQTIRIDARPARTASRDRSFAVRVGSSGARRLDRTGAGRAGARWPAIHAATAASPKQVAPQRITVESLAHGMSDLRRDYGGSVRLLLGLAAVLLAIGGVNVAALLACRALSRRREMAVRLSLGASRRRLFLEHVVEGALLAGVGLAIALPMAWWGTTIITAMVSVGRPTPLDVTLTPDTMVVAVAAIIALAVGALAGLILPGTARSSRRDRRHRWRRAVLAVPGGPRVRRAHRRGDVQRGERGHRQPRASRRAPLAHLRFQGDIEATRRAYVDAVNAGGRHFVRGLFTFDEWLQFAFVQERLLATLSLAAGALAFVLACLGIYALQAHAVTEREREFGIRMAIGANRHAIGRLVLRDSLTCVGAGVLVGLPCAVGLGRLLQSQLYGVASGDVSHLALAAVAFAVTGVGASLVPVWRATTVDPVVTLRSE